MVKRFQKIDITGVYLWLLRAGIITIITWGTISTLISNPYSSRDWINFFVIGITQGSMYALIAIGYTLVYGVLFMINFAHGEFFMSGIMTATVFLIIPMSESGFLNKDPIVALDSGSQS